MMRDKNAASGSGSLRRYTCKVILVLCLLGGNALYAQKIQPYVEGKSEKIFFSGTLLSYSAQTVPPQRLVYEQFFVLSNIYGLYDKNSKLQHNRNIYQYELIPYIKFGIIEHLDCNIITSLVYSHANGDTFAFGDTLVLFGLQLMKAKKETWLPDIRLLVGETFPTGKFDDLDPRMQGGDGVGFGSFETTLILSMAKVFPINKKHALRFDPNLFFFIPSSVKVVDFSVYGGGEGTQGTAHPGNKFAIDFPCEYNLTNRLILGLDIFYAYSDKVGFSSKTPNRLLAGLPSSDNLSLAPCLEYTFNDNFGFEGGVWFSVHGRNSFAFRAGVVVGWWYF